MSIKSPRVSGAVAAGAGAGATTRGHDESGCRGQRERKWRNTLPLKASSLAGDFRFRLRRLAQQRQ